MVTELCKLTRNLFEPRLKPIKGLYIFLCNLSENDIQAKELVALASTCDDLADLFRFQLQHAKELHEAAIVSGVGEDLDSKDDFFDKGIMRYYFRQNRPTVLLRP